MSFTLSARFQQLNTAQKLGILKFLFLFDFVVIFYSLSPHPLPARPLFLIVLHNGVKKIHVIKAWFVTRIGTENCAVSSCKVSKKIFRAHADIQDFIILGKWCPICSFTQTGNIWVNSIQYLWYSYNLSLSCKV